MIGCVGVHGVDANARVRWDCWGFLKPSQVRAVRSFDLIFLLLYKKLKKYRGCFDPRYSATLQGESVMSYPNALTTCSRLINLIVSQGSPLDLQEVQGFPLDPMIPQGSPLDLSTCSRLINLIDTPRVPPLPWEYRDLFDCWDCIDLLSVKGIA